jgi:hypothetical protein
LEAISAAEAWKYPLRKQSLRRVYTLGLGMGMEGERKEGRPRERVRVIRRDSCAVNSWSLMERRSMENLSWWLGFSFFILNNIEKSFPNETPVVHFFKFPKEGRGVAIRCKL